MTRYPDGRCYLCRGAPAMPGDKCPKCGTDQPPVRTMAQAIKDEEELLRRRVVHATRPKGPLTMEEAAALARRMTGESK